MTGPPDPHPRRRGRRGHFAAAVLEAYPQLGGAVLDVPERIEAAVEYLRGRGLGERSAEQAIALPSSFSILDSRPQ